MIPSTCCHRNSHRIIPRIIAVTLVALKVKSFSCWTCASKQFSSFIPIQYGPSNYIRHRCHFPRPFHAVLSTHSNDQSSFSSSSIQSNLPTVAEVDVRYETTTQLTYVPSLDRFIHSTSDLHTENKSLDPLFRRFLHQGMHILQNAFLPEGVNSISYYRYIRWRTLQRYINSIVHVIGTQSLLMGLGKLSSNRPIASSSTSSSHFVLGVHAAIHWVLKDALGKIVRMIWASRMGMKFDSDAKRWRYRSAFLYAMGNGLEIMTYLYPHFFLLFATLGNACKQMSLLTNSATRNAIYNCFRDGSRENIGDITAKGEAQIAVVDLVGIATGVTLSRTVGTSVPTVLSLWIFLQVIEMFCMYKEIRAVVFRMLNFERLCFVINTFVTSYESHIQRCTNGDTARIREWIGTDFPTPEYMSDKEKIFLPPEHLSRRAIAFGSLSRAKLSPYELKQLLEIFQSEKFILVVGEDVKNKRHRWWNSIRASRLVSGTQIRHSLQAAAMENCHIVLHAEATNADIVKGVLSLFVLRRKLANNLPFIESAKSQDSAKKQRDLVRSRRSCDCMALIEEAKKEADSLYPLFLSVSESKGWAQPAKFMFGRVTMRADWPLKDA